MINETLNFLNIYLYNKAYEKYFESASFSQGIREFFDYKKRLSHRAPSYYVLIEETLRNSLALHGMMLPYGHEHSSFSPQVRAIKESNRK